jgi:ribosomal protein S18 acetylase RimI-like enzyme
MEATVQNITIRDCYTLKKLFNRALSEDFAYFPGSYVDSLAKEHSWARFARARFQPSRLLLGMFDNHQLVGYLIADYADPMDADIFWLYVVPESRSKGYGRALLKRGLMDMADAGVSHIYLITHQQQKFYESLGFETLGMRDDLFDGITMAEMGRNLGATQS